MTKLFLSHSSADKTLAYLLKQQISNETAIELENIFVSSEPDAIPQGDWLQTVLQKLDEADAFIALITPLAETSMWVAFEYGYFWGQKGKEKIFVLCHPKATIPSPLNTLQWKHITAQEELSVFFKALCQTLNRKFEGKASLDLIVKTVNETTFESSKDRELKEDLISQMGSSDNATALNAVRALNRRGWLKDGSLRNQIFTGANLQNAELEKADLRGAKLNHANLQEANFIEADLRGADLGGTRFEKLTQKSPRAATFWFANLENAIFGSATLIDVEFGGANLKSVDFRDANLIGAKINDDTQFNEDCILPDGQKWTNKDDLNRFTDWIPFR
jgi:hypothetical protein